MTTCRKIVNWRTYLRFPPEAEAALTPAARDFIARLLSDVEERLGSTLAHMSATDCALPAELLQALPEALRADR